MAGNETAILGTSAWTTNDVASALTIGVVVAFASGALSSARQHKGTSAWRHSFCKLLLVAVVAVEFYFVGLAAVKLPKQQRPILTACTQSLKGGKRATSFRDCEQGQTSRCTADQPCTPCDVPVPWTKFDSLLWRNDCRVCSAANPGLCRYIDSLAPARKDRTEWCLDADNATVPCARCCLNLRLGTQRFESVDDFNQDDCTIARNASWLSESAGALSCADPDFPLATRFGCCPQNAFVPDDADASEEDDSFILGDETIVPACSRSGPRHAGWHYCLDAYEEVQLADGSSASVPAGCPLTVNGVRTGERFCRPPTPV